jgi:hypothetical protein
MNTSRHRQSSPDDLLALADKELALASRWPSVTLLLRAASKGGRRQQYNQSADELDFGHGPGSGSGPAKTWRNAVLPGGQPIA